MSNKVKLNSLQPIFTFTKNKKPIAIEDLPLGTLDKVQKVLYEDIKNVPQEINVEIGGKYGFVYSDYIKKPNRTQTIETKTPEKESAINKDEMLNSQEEIDI